MNGPRPLSPRSCVLLLALLLQAGLLPPRASAGVAEEELLGHVVAQAQCGACHDVNATGPTTGLTPGLALGTDLAPAASSVTTGAFPPQAPSLRSIARSEPALFEGVFLRPGQPMGGVMVAPAEMAPLRAWLRRLEQAEERL